jgi:hypothetical protein
MVHMTLNIPKDLHDRMKSHPEIKWSEVVRRSISEYLIELADQVDGQELAKLLKNGIRQTIEELSEEEIRDKYGQAVRVEWDRMKSLTQAR